MGNKTRLKIVTPERTMFDDDVEMAIMRTEQGDIGVLAGHEPLSTVLAIGSMRIINGEQAKEAAIMAGFAEITPSLITILTQTAEWADEIDVARAKEAKSRAEALLASNNSDINTERALLALRRANVRIETNLSLKEQKSV